MLLTVQMSLFDARPVENQTSDLPIGYIGLLFGTEAQVTSIAFCFDILLLRP